MSARSFLVEIILLDIEEFCGKDLKENKKIN